MRRVLNEGRDAKTTPVTAVMSPNVRHIASTVTVEEALRLMVVHNHRHLLVEDHAEVQGLVSIRDLMSWIVLPETHRSRPKGASGSSRRAPRTPSRRCTASNPARLASVERAVTGPATGHAGRIVRRHS